MGWPSSFHAKHLHIFSEDKNIFRLLIKVMLHGTIRNDDFYRKTALQHCCEIDSNGSNIVPILERCVAQKIVVANCPV